ncbi:50S ribosomal protein L3 [Patescibacteria group bacterium]
MAGIIAKKLGMTEVFDDKGNCIPVTLFEAGPCFVTRTKSKKNVSASSLPEDKETEKDKINIQVGFLKKPKQDKTKTEKQFSYIGEIPLDSKKEWKKNDEIKVDIFAEISKVDVTGISKGKGFSGVVKRHNFSGGPKSHGHRHVLRSPGSTGASAYPARVLKGKKMAGQYGNEQVTIKNLQVIKVDPEKNILVIKGGVPGGNGAIVKIIAKNK